VTACYCVYCSDVKLCKCCALYCTYMSFVVTVLSCILMLFGLHKSEINHQFSSLQTEGNDMFTICDFKCVLRVEHVRDRRRSTGRLFQAHGPATARARSPMVERRVTGTRTSAVDAERSATSNNTKLVQWRWWVGCYIWYSEEGPRLAAAPPSPLLAVTKCNSPPINGQCTNHCIAIMMVRCSAVLMWQLKG